jgi:hypothetical protein
MRKEMRSPKSRYRDFVFNYLAGFTALLTWNLNLGDIQTADLSHCWYPQNLAPDGWRKPGLWTVSVSSHRTLESTWTS